MRPQAMVAHENGIFVLCMFYGEEHLCGTVGLKKKKKKYMQTRKDR